MAEAQAPERIWAFKANTSGQMLCASENRLRSPFAREYVRADIHAAVVAERDQLKAALEKIAKASMGECGCYHTNRVNIRIARDTLTELERHNG